MMRRNKWSNVAKAVIAGLDIYGLNVFLAGMAPTPALQYAVKTRHGRGVM